MNEDVEKDWVKALRSDEYRQGTATLKNVDPEGVVRHCCLGVLCELAVKAGIVLQETDQDGDLIFRSVKSKDDLGYGYLPEAVKDWAGLESINPVIVREDYQQTLSGLNDDDGFSFADIANLIEEQL